MDEPLIQQFKALAVTMLTLSTDHLRHTTRVLMRYRSLSVAADPADTGGFVRVQSESSAKPDEPELAALFDIAMKAGITWLHFDSDGAVIDGLPRFGDSDVARSP